MQFRGGALVVLYIEDEITLREVSPLQLRSLATPTELRERRDVQGAHGWQVNGYGELFKHMRRKSPYAITGGVPVVYLGDQYFGPLLPAFNTHGEVFLDEIVALAYYGLPQVESLKWWPHAGYALDDRNSHVANGVLVHHYDGDGENCRRDNVAWTVDGEFYAAEDAKLLRPTGLHARRKPPGLFPFSDHRYDEPRFTNSDNLPNWLPTNRSRALREDDANKAMTKEGEKVA